MQSSETTGLSVGAPNSGQPSLHLVRLGIPAILAARAARQDMAARMRPELQVSDVDLDIKWPHLAQMLEGVAELPWAMLALPATGPAAIALARQAIADQRPPRCLVLRVEDPSWLSAEAGLGTEPVALDCLVAVVVTASTDGADILGLAEVAALSTKQLVVRTISPDGTLDEIAQLVKEVLEVVPTANS